MGMLDRLPANTIANVSAMGRTQLPITTIALSMGLNVRVGMEDNVYYRRGELVEHNARSDTGGLKALHERAAVVLARFLRDRGVERLIVRAAVGSRREARVAAPVVPAEHTAQRCPLVVIERRDQRTVVGQVLRRGAGRARRVDPAVERHHTHEGDKVRGQRADPQKCHARSIVVVAR